MNLKKKEIKSVENYLEVIKNNLEILKSKDKIVLGVSGGVDSVFLFFSLLQVLRKEQIIIAHLNHGLRKEAIQDEKLVINLCKKYEVSCYVKKIDLKDLADKTKQSLEECGRTERYYFFRELKEKLKAKFILTAHNKDDLAESIILNFSRGSFVKGLVGIKKIDSDLLRPLLDFSKEEIYQLAKKNKLKWFEDETNLDPKFKRNFIRHNVLKPLKELNPCILDKFEKFSLNMHKINEYLSQASTAFFNNNPNGFLLTDFNSFSEILRKEILGLYYEKFNQNKDDLSTDFLDEICRFIDTSGSGKQHEFGNNTLILKNYHEILFQEKKLLEDATIMEQSISIPSKITFGEFNISLKKTTKAVDLKVKNCYFFYLDMDLAGARIKVRTWKNGDKFRPFGMRNWKKLQDLFTDLKVPKAERKIIPIFVSESNDIMAVGNLQISNDFRVTNKTSKILKIFIH